MIKRLLPLVLFVLSLNLLAAPRNLQEALTIAKSFISDSEHNSALRKSEASVLNHIYSSFHQSEVIGDEYNASYHVFNIGQKDGFIIISGNDAAVEVLGYSDSGSFDIHNLPENFKYWLSFYEEELACLDSETTTLSQYNSDSSLRAGSQRNFASSITPLIKTKWDQGEPFNNLCPVIPDGTGSQAVTGCVATAMAQMMKYHTWPVKGTGANSYVTDTYKIPVNADFSATTYDWNNMVNMYTATSTQTQKDVVATLMYHCGVASNMDYGYSSGASSRDMGIALIDNFNYDENLQVYSRDYYTRQEWEEFIKEELNQARPVFYRGNTARSGHLFLLDGYDTNNMFHINWGWGGSADGYFVLSSLTPKTVGAGGDSGGYNFNQEAFLGVQKPNGLSNPVYQIVCREKFIIDGEVERHASLNFSAFQLRNLGINSFAGTIALGLFQEEELKFSFASRTLSTSDPLLPGYGWSEFKTNAPIPQNVPEGEYRLYIIYKAEGESDWHRVRMKVGVGNYFIITITPSYVYCNADVDKIFNLTLSSLSAGSQLYQNKNGRFNIEIKNEKAEYNSVISLSLKSVSTNEYTEILSNEPVNIVPGETKKLNVLAPVLVAPGEYTLHVYYDRWNNMSTSPEYVQLGDSINITVLPTPTEEPNLTVTTPVSFADPNNVPKNNIELTARIKNTGGLFDNTVVAFIYPASGGSSLISYGRQYLLLDKNEEATVVFTGSVDLEPGVYLTAIRYVQEGTTIWGRFTPEDDARTIFTLVEATTETNNYPYESCILYPNPVNNYVYFNSIDMVRSVDIYDTMGRLANSVPVNSAGEITVPVMGLNNGVYFIRIKKESGTIQTGRFIK